MGLHSVLEPSSGSGPSILDAESPASLENGKKLAFLRQINGRKQLFVRDLARPGQPDQQLTTATSPWNVEEIAISPGKSLVVSATKGDASSRLYEVHGVDQLELIPAGEARYPAISPDGRWLAFSIFRSGYWNLSLRDLSTGATRRLTNVSLRSNCARLAARLQNAPLQQRLWPRLGFTAILQATLSSLTCSVSLTLAN